MNVSEHKLKEQICEIGRQLYAEKDCTDGNITIRLNDKEILCTPTMVSKGFMKPEDICKVDYEGKQIAGSRRRTSEVLLHLAVYKTDLTLIRWSTAILHATAFTIAHRTDPQVRVSRSGSFSG